MKLFQLFHFNDNHRQIILHFPRGRERPYISKNRLNPCLYSFRLAKEERDQTGESSSLVLLPTRISGFTQFVAKEK